MRPLLPLCLVALLGMAGCRHAPVVYPPAPPLYYAVSFQRARSTEAGVLPRQSDVLAEDAVRLLKPGKRVAFLPPDTCTTSSVSPSGASRASTSILMQCGALLASLEAEVAKAGYSVVSWQALKSSGSADSQQRARALGVDILFEVNQLSQESREPGAQQLSNLRFSREEGPDRSTPLPVMPEVARRCASQLSGLQREGEQEHLSTVNLKAVEVASGRALWLYQNTVLELDGHDERVQSKLYYRAQGTRPAPPEVDGGPAGTIGGLLLSIGGGVAVAGLIGTLTESDGSSSSDTPGTLMTLGLVGAGSGAALIGLDYFLSAPDRSVPPATYPTEDQVLCAVAPERDPWTAPTSQAVQAPVAQYSYTFSESAAGERDLSRERTERLTRRSTEAFVQALRELARK